MHSLGVLLLVVIATGLSTAIAAAPAPKGPPERLELAACMSIEPRNGGVTIRPDECVIKNG